MALTRQLCLLVCLVYCLLSHFGALSEVADPPSSADSQQNWDYGKWDSYQDYGGETPIPAVVSHSSTGRCNRFRSRLVRKVLEEEVLPVIEEADVEIPKDCILNPKNDLLREHELQKKEMWRDQWRCLLCSKTFRSEYYLDKHLENKHSTPLGSAQNGTGVCLGDLCDIFDCASIVTELKADGRFPAEGEGHPAPLPEPAECKDNVMTKRRIKCQAVFHKCFPQERSDANRHLSSTFAERYCEHLTCAARASDRRWRTLASKASFRSRRVFQVFGAFLVLGLACFYICLFFCRGGRSHQNDLRRLHGATRLRMFSRPKSKKF